jgi:hypothetical protein
VGVASSAPGSLGDMSLSFLPPKSGNPSGLSMPNYLRKTKLIAVLDILFTLGIMGTNAAPETRITMRMIIRVRSGVMVRRDIQKNDVQV